jgi:peptidoglycan/LPS O-acetylase OafA/YrhL
MSEKTTSPTYFGGLNMLRAFCALAIIVYHTSLSFQDKMPSMVKMFLHNLTLGVDMFFIISGFIIIYLLLVEKQTTNKIDFIKFYIRRALRIFPLYFLVVGIAYLIYHNSNPTIDFSKYAYFASNFWMIAKNDWTVGILNPLWSLCIEEHFYLVIPLLIYITPLKRVNLVLIGAVAVSILFRIYACHTVQYNWMTIYCHTLSRCDLMAIGGLIAYYYMQHNTTQHNTTQHNTTQHIIHYQQHDNVCCFRAAYFTNVYFGFF